MTDEPAETATAIVESSTCLACGCLCDDIRVKVQANRIVEAANACRIGLRWFLSPRPGEGHPIASIDGRPVELAEAIDRAAEILRLARAPVIWGLTGSTIETVAAALAIADRIGAVVDLAGSSEGGERLAAFQRVGQVSASLGEVKDRADVVVFWGVDPLVTHPRHWERYSVDPRGRFLPEGRAGRFVIVVDSAPTETSRAADLFVRIDPDRQAEALDVVRAMVKGVKLDLDRVERSTGLEISALEGLAARLMTARYGAFFHGPNLGRGFVGAFALIRDLNEARRFVAMELGGPGNPAGASSVLTWQAGAPSAVDFGLGSPRHLPGEASLIGRMALGEVDAVLIIADRLPDEMATLPTIQIGPGATVGDRPPTVGFDVARPGIESGGTVCRVDGVMLPLRPAIDSGLPTDREILEAIRRRIDPL
jgi:formylmethanofuran dehydrogenase subunit B